MTYFECAECGQLADLSVFEHRRLRQECPVCERETDWVAAFRAEGADPW